MTIQRACDTLEATLRRFADSVRHLVLTIDDVPEISDEPAVVDALRTAVGDIQAEADALLARLASDSTKADVPAALAGSQETCNRIAFAIRRSLVTHANVREIENVARERGGAWTRWSDAVRQSFAECENLVDLTGAALLDCWRELVDRGAVTATPPEGRRQHA